MMAWLRPARAVLLASALGVGGAGCGSSSRASTSPAPPVPPDSEQEAMLAFVDYLGSTFHERYAPQAYKRQAFGWDLDAELARLRAEAVRSPKPESFRRALYLFFRSTRDLHTHVAFDDERAVWVGLHLKKVEGVYRVAWIDRATLPREQFPAEVGDEVVSLDGAPIETAIAATREVTQWRSTPGFEQAMAERLVLLRAASEWDTIPTAGAVARLVVRRDQRDRELTFRWLDMGASPPRGPCPFWGKTRTSYVPPLGKVIWTNTANLFPAHVFEATSAEPRPRLRGYLRLHTYEVEPRRQPEGAQEIRAAIDEFARQGVSSVVLDQTGNGGGSYQYVLSSLARLFGEPLLAPRYRYMVAGHGVIAGFGGRSALEQVVARLDGVHSDEAAAQLMRSEPLFAETLNYLPPRRASVAQVSDLLRFFLGQPVPAEPTLTAPQAEIFERFSASEAEGSPLRVPVVVVVDEVTLSAPEFGAAALADSGRATIFGTTTAGAGGNQRWFSRDSVCPPGVVRDERFLSECVPRATADTMRRLGIRGFGVTMTLGVRVLGDGTLGPVVENQGVTPQVDYRLTARDLREDFGPMRERLAGVLSSLEAGRAGSGSH